MINVASIEMPVFERPDPLEQVERAGRVRAALAKELR